MSTSKYEDFKSEYQEFMSINPKEVPPLLSQKVLSSIFPSPFRVFFHFLVLHFFAGSLTLFICPQFGFSPIKESLNLMSYVMPFGKLACAIFCSTVYFSATVMASHLVLSPPMLAVIKTRSLVYFPALVAVSFGFFMLLSPQTAGVRANEFAFAFTWILTGILVTPAFFHALFHLRRVS